MTALLSALAIYGIGASCALTGLRSGRGARWARVCAAMASALVLLPALRVLSGAPPIRWSACWALPCAAFDLCLDPLSAVFAAVIGLLTGLAAIYGGPYLRHALDGRPAGPAWFHFNLLAASMLVVVTAANAVLFLIAWEIMTLASFFLVPHDHRQERARAAGWIYLVATHIGTAFLLVLFVLLAGGSGCMDFASLAAGAGWAAPGILFVLALVGFGVKAGFMPLHVWLPEAHPAAPSHVSALMSGVMIKTGIYGILRILTILPPLPAWAGWLMLAMGLASGVLGVLFALAQHDLKRLLAYSSVENIGIIGMGIGLGLIGLDRAAPLIALLGFGGALLHVVNHTLFKGLLFLGAGAVVMQTGTLEMDHLGGLMKRMPRAGLAFFVGAAAIAGLPPLNGFVSELLIYVGAFRAILQSGTAFPIAGLAVVLGLAVIGVLAAACFAKVVGIAFLGEPRTPAAGVAREPPAAMWMPMMALAGFCLAIGLLAPLAVRMVLPAADMVAGLGVPPVELLAAGGGLRILARVSLLAGGFLLVVAGLLWLVACLRRGREVADAVTWDCGYAAPSARMQYTASSFARPIIAHFRSILGAERRVSIPAGYFPANGVLHSKTEDSFKRRFYAPVFAAIAHAADRWKCLQHGRMQLYILYIAAVLLILLVWELTRR